MRHAKKKIKTEKKKEKKSTCGDDNDNDNERCLYDANTKILVGWRFTKASIATQVKKNKKNSR